MTNDLVLLEPRVEMHAVRYGGVSYPVVFSCLAVKRWAEYRGQTFAEAFGGGWTPEGMSDEDVRELLRLALEAGERRRRLFATDENREVEEDLIDHLFATYHPLEILSLLARAWSEVPERAPNPPMPVAPTTGEPSSE